MNRYAVFGNPISHSKSPQIHQAFAKQLGLKLSYEAILAPLDGFADNWRQFVSSGGRGANITVPFKEIAFDVAERLSERALIAGSVNTFYFNAAGEVVGDNTDGLGLVADLQRLGFALQDIDVLILGAGGACRGVVEPLLAAGVATVTVANRTAMRAEVVADNFARQVSGHGYDDIPLRRYSLVINATSMGLKQQRPPLDTKYLAGCVLAYDMMYGAVLTPFLQWCQQHGVVQVADGLGMLVGQAAESFYLWHGVKPDIVPVLQSLRSAMQADLGV